MVTYNSMILITYSGNTYWPVQVSSAFVENPSAPFLYEPQFENRTSEDLATKNTLPDGAVELKNEVGRLRTLLEQNTLERLETTSCIDAYNVKYQTSYGSLLLVSANSSSTVHQECTRKCSVNFYGNNFLAGSLCSSVDNSEWMCAGAYLIARGAPSCLTQAQELRSSASHWTPNGAILDSR